jgi:murein DD-endopeptidase MepM/ murein hydrolase activator NlpD
MNFHLLTKQSIFIIILIGNYSAFSQSLSNGGYYSNTHVECISASQKQKMMESTIQNIETLKTAGKIKPYKKTRNVSLEWPLRLVNGTNYCSYYGISNYVDHNLNFPNQLTDFNCGTRSYDLAGGYNHAGTDIFLWPFDWQMKNEGSVEVIAAAPGILVNKYDGNTDNNCNFNNPNWNAVCIQMYDGNLAWYGHLKNGSVLFKMIGDSIYLGEKLGSVASSGSSTGPHLHFELLDILGNVFDPYTGICNPAGGWWSANRPYYEPKINAAFTHSAPPQYNACPLPATTNIKDTFQLGDSIYFCGYFADQLTTIAATYTITKPNNTVFATWTHLPPVYYTASYWYWDYQLPATTDFGQWKFNINLEGKICTHSFEVLPPAIPANLQSNLFNQDFTILSNPCHEILQVDAKNNLQIRLYNLQGQIIKTFSSNKKVNMLDVNSGLYILKTNLFTHKLMVQH